MTRPTRLLQVRQVLQVQQARAFHGPMSRRYGARSMTQPSTGP